MENRNSMTNLNAHFIMDDIDDIMLHDVWKSG